MQKYLEVSTNRFDESKKKKNILTKIHTNGLYKRITIANNIIEINKGLFII